MTAEMNPLEVLKTITWKDHRKKIFEEQQYLFDNNLECDCVLISAQGKRILAHQIVLSTSSEFFRKILSELPSHVELPTIHLPDADTCILEAIVKFVYTGQVYIGLIHLTVLMEFCNFLGIKCYVENKFTVRKIGNECNQTVSAYGSTVQPYNKSSSESSSGDEYLTRETDDVNHQELEDDLESIEPDYLEEYLDDESVMDVKEEQILIENEDYGDIKNETVHNEFIAYDAENTAENIEIACVDESQMMMRRQCRRQGTRSTNIQIDKALNEVNNGKTIHRLSVEYNLPRSTLYHRFRNNENLKQNYRSERKSALDNAVRAVLNERLSLKMAADRYKVVFFSLFFICFLFKFSQNYSVSSLYFQLPKTAIWREVRKCEQYQPSTKEITIERQNAQNEILCGKSLTSISAKYSMHLQ